MKNRVFQPKQLAIKDHQGATLTDSDKIMDRWKEYGEKLFDSPSASNSPLPPPQEDIVTEPNPLRSEVEYALKKLKSNKSPELDNIPAELIKAGGPSMINAVHKLCCKIWTSTDWPQDWKQQEMVMLHKAGDSKECGNYRTIALISHTSKIMLYIILERIKEKVERELAEEQAGFRPGRGTGDMLCAIQILIEKMIENRNEAYIIFIDYSKAFDSVNHSELFTTLSQMGFPMHIVRLIQALYTDQEVKIRWNGSHIDSFKIGKGVRQGCILSPHLFNT